MRMERLRQILTGWLFWLIRKNNGLSRKRMNVCKTCDYKRGKWISVCWLCGCVLQAKTRVKSAYCNADKWEKR